MRVCVVEKSVCYLSSVVRRTRVCAMAESLLLSTLYKHQMMERYARDMEKVVKNLTHAIKKSGRKFGKGKAGDAPKLSKEDIHSILKELHNYDQLLLKLRLRVDDCSNYSVWVQKQIRLMQISTTQ